MFRYVLLPVGLILLLLLSSTAAGERDAARIERVADMPRGELRATVNMATADTCQVRQDLGSYYLINGWVTGAELYKSYLDPIQSCPGPYPFTITEINMPMYFATDCSLTVSVDVEAVDLTDPACPAPGDLLSISSEWTLAVPGEGLYDIWIPLDTPVVVNGPFFAGFYIGNQIDTSVHAAVVTDSVPVECRSYNVWDPEVGYIDLVYNTYWNFPGHLILFASGIPGGGSGVDPDPAIAWVSPSVTDEVLYKETELWARELSGSSSIERVEFEYSDGGEFVDIGIDYDGTLPLRNGVDPTEDGSGYSMVWDFSHLSEGLYTLRATVVDTAGRTASVTREVTLEPTPPIPRIVDPPKWSFFCPPTTFIFQCSDENLTYIELRARALADNYSAGIFEMAQSLVGDADGDPYDGNPANEGEFGDYYSAPVAGTQAVRLWFDRGYPSAMKSGYVNLGMAEVAESLAVVLDTRAQAGTRDDWFYGGLSEYVFNHGNELKVTYARLPDYHALRVWAQDEERAVLLGLGGNVGMWMVIDGFKGWKAPDNTYTIAVCNPLTGITQDFLYREPSGYGELFVNGEWYTVDMAVTVYAPDWSISRTLAGADLNPADGWSVEWNPTTLVEGTHFSLRAATQDATLYPGWYTLMLPYTCSSVFAPGDFNDDGAVDVSDLYYLIQFMTMDGPEPVGGMGRADCNCDRYVNSADIVYFMNYLFGGTSAPCY